MNKIMAQYLASVATTAEHAPFGAPGLWNINYMFNNSLVWAASSLVTARQTLENEATEENEQRVENALFKFHTVKMLRGIYADEVAIPALEQPHVARYLGLDKEPDTVALEETAKREARAAFKNARIAGRPTKGLVPKVYNQKLASMREQREARAKNIVAVYSAVHEDCDPDFYDEGHRLCEDFIEKMEDSMITVARAGWVRAREELTDTSMQTFKPTKYNRLSAQLLSCQTFLEQQGITETKLIDWATKLNDAADGEAEAFAGSLKEAEAEADAEMAALDIEIANTPNAATEAKKVIKHVKSKARLEREAEDHRAASAKNKEDEVIAAKKAARSAAVVKAAATRAAKKANANQMERALASAVK